MKGKKRLTIEYALKQPHYRNILSLITDAQKRGKKIKFEHLKYILVKNTAKKLSDKKIKELKKFFAWEKTETWPSGDGKVREIRSIIEFLEYISKDLTKKMNRVNDLWGFLKNLIDLGLIERRKSRRKKAYYRMTLNGIFYFSIKCSIEITVESFLDYVFSKERAVCTSAWMLGAFETRMLKIIEDILKEEKEQKVIRNI